MVVGLQSAPASRQQDILGKVKLTASRLPRKRGRPCQLKVFVHAPPGTLLLKLALGFSLLEKLAGDQVLADGLKLQVH